MPQARVLHTAEFSRWLRVVPSARVRERIRRLEESLTEFPDMGSPQMRRSLIVRYRDRTYGGNLRKVAVGGYVIIYAHKDDEVIILGVLSERAVR